MKHQVIFNYSQQDIGIVTQIQDDLRAEGLTVWAVSHADVSGAAFQQAVENAGCMVVILSPNWAQSPQVMAAIDLAAAKSIPILPTIVRGDEWSAIPRMFVGKRTYDLRANYPRQFQKLVAGIRAAAENRE
jgi:TIR domain-containing protein